LGWQSHQEVQISHCFRDWLRRHSKNYIRYYRPNDGYICFRDWLCVHHKGSDVIYQNTHDIDWVIPRNIGCLEPGDGSCQPITFSLIPYLCCSSKQSCTFHIFIFGTTCKMVMLKIFHNVPDVSDLQWDQILVSWQPCQMVEIHHHFRHIFWCLWIQTSLA